MFLIPKGQHITMHIKATSIGNVTSNLKHESWFETAFDLDYIILNVNT